MQKARKKDYRKNKAAFDAVLSYYRGLGNIGSISAINVSSGSKASRNPAKPTPHDFRCDVEKVIKKIVPLKHFAKFCKAYVFVEATSDLEQEKWADKVLGAMRHSFEQRLGEQFVQRKIFPVQGRGYFYSIRKSRMHK